MGPHVYQLIFVIFVISDSTFSKRMKSDRIISGRLADIEEFPQQVSIQIHGVSVCGGSILNRYVILTAAHCVPPLSDVPAKARTLRVGSSNAYKGGRVHQIEKMVPHPRYNDSAPIDEHDIALFVVKTPIVFNKRVQPVKLTNKPTKVGLEGQLSGFGITNDKHGGVDLMAVDLPTIPLKKCQKILAKEGATVTNDMICAGHLKGHKDACSGDSGGPYVIDNVQHGVVAWGIGCGTEGLPGVYTSVYFYRNWIKDTKKRIMASKERKH